MCCMMFLCFMTVLYSLLPVLQYYKPDMADKADLLCLIVVAPYQIMFHVVFFTVFYVKVKICKSSLSHFSGYTWLWSGQKEDMS